MGGKTNAHREKDIFIIDLCQNSVNKKGAYTESKTLHKSMYLDGQHILTLGGKTEVYNYKTG